MLAYVAGIVINYKSFPPSGVEVQFQIHNQRDDMHPSEPITVVHYGKKIAKFWIGIPVLGSYFTTTMKC